MSIGIWLKQRFCKHDFVREGDSIASRLYFYRCSKCGKLFVQDLKMRP